ncbi:MAG: amidohydrolase family protein, partial [Acidobacteria bacterium]|nr:amidohydrolase family protein [Acidobacteriota bacterium]
DYIWNAGIGFEIYDRFVGCTTAKKIDPSRPVNDENSQDCADLSKDYATYPDYGMYRSARAILEAGLRIGYLHITSDGSWDMLFHMIEEAIAKGKVTPEQVKAMRITTEHTPRIRPEQVAKITQYGIRVNMTGRTGGAESFLKMHGEQYQDWFLPMKSLVDANAHPMLNTDAHIHDEAFQFQPIETMGGKIWDWLEFYLTRRTGNSQLPVLASRQAVDRVNLMKAATIWNAEGVLNEKNIGSLEVGKLADFIVLDKDYFTVPEDQVHTINTMLTAVGGKIEFKSPSY